MSRNEVKSESIANFVHDLPVVGTVGQGRVSFLEMSRYLRRSKSQTKKDLLYLANEGLIDVIALFSDAGAKKYYVSLTDVGDEYLMQNFDAAIAEYHLHVAEVINAIRAEVSNAPFTPKRMSKKQISAAQTGQLKMEGFE